MTNNEAQRDNYLIFLVSYIVTSSDTDGNNSGVAFTWNVASSTTVSESDSEEKDLQPAHVQSKLGTSTIAYLKHACKRLEGEPNVDSNAII